jgi:uncharacterized protein (TIGR02594 family)
MPLPQNFLFLADPGMPKMIQEAVKLYGTKEVTGPEDNKVIMAWATDLGISHIYTHDELAWCSLAHAVVAKRAGYPVPFKEYELLRAASWAAMKSATEPVWGTFVPRGEEMCGDTLVFKRPGGYHVGLYVGESKTTFFVLGGNSSNMYKIVEIEKIRLVACRRPVFKIGQPASVKKIWLDASGNVSHNES